MAAGEGIETMASLRMVMPAVPVIAGLSADHLAALLPSRPAPALHRRRRGRRRPARHERLGRRAGEAGIVTLTLRPQLGDFNDDLRRGGPMRSVSTSASARPGRCRPFHG